MKRLKFTEHEATTHNAIIVSFDLGGFSAFCNQPTASTIAPKLVKKVFDVLNEYFVDPENEADLPTIETAGKLPTPKFIKFTGDGALIFWTQPNKKDFSQEFCNAVVDVMRKFQEHLARDLPACERQWRIHNLPKQARIGIAAGIVYALRPPHSFTSLTEPCDYVGYCINLAVRLQDHCPKLGFLVHGVLHPELGGMDRFTAVEMKSAQHEPIAMFKQDAIKVPSDEFNAKFKPMS